MSFSTERRVRCPCSLLGWEEQQDFGWQQLGLAVGSVSVNVLCQDLLWVHAEWISEAGQRTPPANPRLGWAPGSRGSSSLGLTLLWPSPHPAAQTHSSC